MPDPSTSITRFAEAYRQAALVCRPGDMVEAAKILEALRKRLSEQSIYDALKKRLTASDVQMEEAFWLAMTKLQFGLMADYGRQKVDEITQALATDPVAGEALMVRAFAEGLSNWEVEVYEPVMDASFAGLSESGVKLQNRWKQLHQYILESRWVECLPEFKAFAEHTSIPADVRSSFHLTVGQVYLYSLNQEEEAGAWFDRAAKLTPDNSRVFRSYGEASLRSRAFEEARRHFLKALSMDESEPDNYFYMGDTYRDEGNLEAAENWYADAHKINPVRLDYYSRMISVYGHPTRIKDQEPQLLALLEHARKVDTISEINKGNNLYNTYRDAGIAYQNCSMYDQAEIWYDQATTLQPSWITAWLDKGYLYSLQQKYDQAKSVIQKAIDLAPGCFDGHWAMAIACDNNREYEKAIVLYEKCLKMRPEWYDSIINTIGVMYDLQSKYAEAIPCYKQAVEKNPKNTVYLSNLAAAFEKLSDFNQSMEYRKRLTELDPTNLATYDNLIEACTKSGQPFDEEQIRKRALDNNPQNHDAHNKLAIYYHDHGQFDLARTYYDQAIALKPDDEVLQTNLASLLKDQSKFAEALKEYLILTSRFPEKDTYWNQAGFCSFQLPDYPSALTYMQKAYELNPANYVYPDNIGVVYDRLGDAPNAELYYRKALEIAPEESAHLIWNRLGLLEYREFRYEEAARDFATAFRINPENHIYAGNIALAKMYLGDIPGTIENLKKVKQLAPEDTYFFQELKTIAQGWNDDTRAASFLKELEGV